MAQKRAARFLSAWLLLSCLILLIFPGGLSASLGSDPPATSLVGFFSPEADNASVSPVRAESEQFDPSARSGRAAHIGTGGKKCVYREQT